jgi:hypothetical protein
MKPTPAKIAFRDSESQIPGEKSVGSGAGFVMHKKYAKM